MLTISQLNCWFPNLNTPDTSKDDKQVLHDISLSIDEGETVALVGESGSGKSITALTVLRLLEETTAIKTEGRILFEDQNLLDITLSDMRSIRGNRISMIFQEPMTSLNPVYTIGDQLTEPLRIHRDMDKQKAYEEAVSLLEKTDLPEPRKRLKAYPHQLSGGQRQRVMIAMALACRPSLLIADEPTTALDVSIQAQILRLIKDLQNEFKMAVLLITHDLTMVREQAEYIYIMKDGSIVEEGKTETVFSRPKNDYTRKLLEAIPHGSAVAKPSGKALLVSEQLRCSFRLPDGWKFPLRRKYLEIKAVDNIDLTIEQGSTCGIVGESGSGKTTLGLALLKLTPSRGSIIFNGINLQTLSARDLRPLRKKIQIVFQDPFSSLSPRLSVLEIIEEGLRVHHKNLSKKQRLQLVIDIVDEVGLDREVIYRYPHEFSGGQRQRIAIARAMILKPELLILDEPTSALDMTIQAQIIDLLRTIQKRHNLTYLFISHDLRIIKAISDHIIVMQEGKIVEAGSAQSVFDNPQNEYTKELFMAALGRQSS